jgi:hypothetical protein
MEQCQHSSDGLALLAFVYCNHNWQYFISTCSNIAGSDPIQHVWLFEPIEMYKELQHEFIMQNCLQVEQLYVQEN